MGELRLPGLATGIDTAALIQQLMEVNSRRLRLMQQDLQKTQQKKDAMDELAGKLQAFRTAARALSNSSQLRSYVAKTSDSDVMTVEAASKAAEGNHEVEIGQLATSERWIHSGFANATTYVGAGTLFISYNNQELKIQTTEDTTLEDLVGLINNDQDNPGVTATLLKHDNGSATPYHLVLNGQDSGSDYQITINASNTEVWKTDAALQRSGDNAAVTTRLRDLDGFTGEMESGSTSDRIRITGTTHEGTTVDVYFDVTRYTTIEDVLREVEKAYNGSVSATYADGIITLTDKFSGTSNMGVTLSFVPGTDSTALLTLPTFSQNTQGGGEASTLTSLLPATWTESKNAQDSKIRVDGYPVSTSAEVQALTSLSDATSGTYRLYFNGEETGDLNYNDDLATIQAALNALSTIQAVGGVTVGGTPPSDSGSALTFTFSAEAGNVPEIVLTHSTLGPTAGDHGISTQTQGEDGWIGRSSNTIDDVITGVTLHLHDTTASGETVDLTLTRDTASLKEKLNEMITAYNTVVMYIQEQTKFAPDGTSRGILATDYFVTTIWSQIKQPFQTAARGFGSNDSFMDPEDIGLDIGADGMLELDESTFDEAIVEDYLGVLRLLGAQKTGASDSTTIKFYGAADSTTAGTYNVKVVVSGGAITSAKIWGRDETEADARDATWDGNTVTGNSTTNSSNDYLYPENNLQFTVDLTTDGTYTATINVKQGFVGAVYELVDNMLDSVDGTMPVAQDALADTIKNHNQRIEREQNRLDAEEQRLVAKFARLERMLALINSQLSGLTTLS